MLLLLLVGLSIYERYSSTVHGGGINTSNLVLLIVLLALVECLRNVWLCCGFDINWKVLFWWFGVWILFESIFVLSVIRSEVVPIVSCNAVIDSKGFFATVSLLNMWLMKVQAIQLADML